MATYVFTSATLGYLPKVRVLAESVKAHNPRAVFCLLLGENGPVDIAVPEVDEVVTLDQLGLPDCESWAFRHSLVELCTAIKGRFLVQLLARPDCEAVFYFDPDIVVFTALARLSERFADGPVLLTPHLIDPEESLEAIADNEIAALKHGVYNLGFLAVQAGAVGEAFAAWWWRRLEHFCRADIAGGLFTDQRWIDLAPAFFDGVTVVRDPTWNVATWNLGQREVEGSLNEGLRIDGRPLLFYHFSGFDSGAQLAMLNKYGRRMKGLYELREWYVERCRKLDDDALSQRPWPLQWFDNGAPVRDVHRHLYRQRKELQTSFPNPYATADPARSYYHWFESDPGATALANEDDPVRLADYYRNELERVYQSRSWKAVRWLRKLAGRGGW